MEHRRPGTRVSWTQIGLGTTIGLPVVIIVIAIFLPSDYDD